MNIYVPKAEVRPLLLRPLGWAGGMTPIALLLVLALSGPVVLGGIALIVEFDAVYRADPLAVAGYPDRRGRPLPSDAGKIRPSRSFLEPLNGKGLESRDSRPF